MTRHASPAFTHPAFFYDDDADYLDTLVPFVVEGVEAGEPVAIAVPTRRLELLREALGGHVERVWARDMVVAGGNPGRILATVLGHFADRHPGRRVRIVGEPVWPGRDATEYPACARHEALINLAFADRAATILCPYDAAALEPHVLAEARATHPEVWAGGARGASDRYAPHDVLLNHNHPLPHVPHATVHAIATAAEIRPLRGVITLLATDLGLPGDRVPDLELVFSELVANSLTHGGGRCTLAVWREGHRLVCSVSDTGSFTDPLAGTRPLTVGQPSGRGLWLVHSIADLVRVHTGDAGTTIRAYFRLS